jgi:hypothetical protein
MMKQFMDILNISTFQITLYLLLLGLSNHYYLINNFKLLDDKTRIRYLPKPTFLI